MDEHVEVFKAGGGWRWIARHTVTPRIAVFGLSADDARRNLRDRLRKWAALGIVGEAPTREDGGAGQAVGNREGESPSGVAASPTLGGEGSDRD